MKYTADGGKTWLEVDEIRISYNCKAGLDDEDGVNELVLTFTEEGMIADGFTTAGEPNGTFCQEISDLIQDLH